MSESPALVFPVGMDHRRVVPLEELRNQQSLLLSRRFDEMDIPLIDACVSYVCCNAPQFRANVPDHAGGARDVTTCDDATAASRASDCSP